MLPLSGYTGFKRLLNERSARFILLKMQRGASCIAMLGNITPMSKDSTCVMPCLVLKINTIS